MAKLHISFRKIQIDKANTRIVSFVAGAVFITVFSMVASRSLLNQRAYQSRVISAKAQAAQQLKDNINATQSLVTAYTEFVSEPTNVLGGNPKGSGDKDGDNAKIVLDALPSKYDFPALATSLEKILTAQNYKINTITGTDDELNQQKAATVSQPVEMPFQIGVSGSYDSMQNLIITLERSIRPIQIQTLDLSASSGNVQINIKAKTFYQPETNLNVTTTKEIK
jgi:hypothetical protein